MHGSDRPKAVSLGVAADEVRGVIGAPGSNVFRNLRKRAKRPATLDSRPFIMGSNYMLGSFMSVHPFIQSGYGVKTICAIAALAMRHSGYHEQSNGALSALAADFAHHTGVVVDRILRRDQSVAPSVIQQKLSAVGNEFAEVWIGRVQDVLVKLVGESYISVEVQGPEVPGWVLEDQVFEMGSHDRWLRSAGKRFPVPFTA